VGFGADGFTLLFAEFNTHNLRLARAPQQKREALIKEPVLCFMNYEIHLRPKGEKRTAL